MHGDTEGGREGHAVVRRGTERGGVKKDSVQKDKKKKDKKHKLSRADVETQNNELAHESTANMLSIQHQKHTSRLVLWLFCPAAADRW